MIAALLTFPHAVPWMIAFWLLWYCVAALRGRRGWLPLALGAAIVAAKGVPWTRELGLFALLLAAVIAANQWARRLGDPKWTRRLLWAGTAILWVAWCAMALDWYGATHCQRALVLRPGQPVVCIGDSLTSMGPPWGGYPEHLARLVSLPVVNLGDPGTTTAQAVRLIPQIRDARPQVVVIELGGNDFVREWSRLEKEGSLKRLIALLRGDARQAVRENLDQLIAACQDAGAEVVLVEVPRGYMFDLFFGLERQLARKHGLELIPDTMYRRMLLASPALPPGQWTGGPFLTQDDGLHPNERGNRFIAARVAATLERMYGPAIRREGP